MNAVPERAGAARAAAFNRWWKWSIRNGTLPTGAESLAREAYYAAWGDGSSLVGVQREDVARVIEPYAWKLAGTSQDGVNHEVARAHSLRRADAVLALPHTGQPQEGAWAFDQACCDAIKEWLETEAPTGARENVHSGHIFWLMTRIKRALSASPASPCAENVGVTFCYKSYRACIKNCPTREECAMARIGT